MYYGYSGPTKIDKARTDLFQDPWEYTKPKRSDIWNDALCKHTPNNSLWNLKQIFQVKSQYIIIPGSFYKINRCRKIVRWASEMISLIWILYYTYALLCNRIFDHSGKDWQCIDLGSMSKGLDKVASFFIIITQKKNCYWCNMLNGFLLDYFDSYLTFASRDHFDVETFCWLCEGREE